LTGHLVFSTVHTNDAASAYTRLLDLGVEEFLLNAALVSIVAQRLVRKLCQHCSEPLLESDTQLLSEKYKLPEFCDKFNLEILNLRRPNGCEHCNHSGFQGRVAVIEYLRCDDAIRQLPKDENFVMRAKLLNKERGGRDLISDGLLKALQGITTLDEVLRVAG
jgi:general secretion pathway protein E